MWRPHRSPWLGRSLVPASTAVARYASAASVFDALGGPRAHRRAGEHEEQDRHHDSDHSSHACLWPQRVGLITGKRVRS